MGSADVSRKCATGGWSASAVLTCHSDRGAFRPRGGISQWVVSNDDCPTVWGTARSLGSVDPSLRCVLTVFQKIMPVARDDTQQGRSNAVSASPVIPTEVPRSRVLLDTRLIHDSWRKGCRDERVAGRTEPRPQGIAVSGVGSPAPTVLRLLRGEESCGVISLFFDPARELR